MLAQTITGPAESIETLSTRQLAASDSGAGLEDTT